jgi:putative sporulation protein YtaF
MLGSEFASIVAMAMLCALGVWMILHARLQSWHERIHEKKTAPTHVTIFAKPHHADIDDSQHIDFVEGTVLGFALSINNVGGGLSAGVLGVDPLLVGFLSAVISFCALFAGNYVADFFIQKRISDKAAIIGGGALIVIGVKQLF